MFAEDGRVPCKPCHKTLASFGTRLLRILPRSFTETDPPPRIFVEHLPFQFQALVCLSTSFHSSFLFWRRLEYLATD